MTDPNRDSAFVDSPEDLMARARRMVDEGTLAPGVAILMSDLCRELRKSREGHASRVTMTAAANAERISVEAERNDLREEKKWLTVDRDRFRAMYRRERLFAFAFGFVGLLATLLLALEHVHR